MNVTTLAKSVGLTHTAINNITSAMQQNKIVVSMVEKKDERQRLLCITPKGKEIIIKLIPVLQH